MVDLVEVCIFWGTFVLVCVPAFFLSSSISQTRHGILVPLKDSQIRFQASKNIECLC